MKELLDAVVVAARKVEFYRHFGNHGDGKDKAAQRELERALAAVRRAVEQPHA